MLGWAGAVIEPLNNLSLSRPCFAEPLIIGIEGITLTIASPVAGAKGTDNKLDIQEGAAGGSYHRYHLVLNFT